MSISQTIRTRPFAVSALAVAVFLLTATQPARAQQAARGPTIPLDAKGYQASMIRQEYLQQRERMRPAPARTMAARPTPAATSVQVAVILPPEPAPVYISLRGPDGEVSRFPLEGGRRAVRPREIVVHPGETATIRFVALAPLK